LMMAVTSFMVSPQTRGGQLGTAAPMEYQNVFWT
jgi:hypothetical protein